MKKIKTLWVLWWMWPEATICFYKDLTKLFQDRQCAVYDSDFPRMLITNVPLPDIVEWKWDKKEAEEMLIREAKNLEDSWADIIVMPCNTAHIFEDKIRENINCKFISIVDSLKEKISDQKSLLLSTKTTRDYWIYRWNNIQEVNDEEQNIVTAVIMDVLAWNFDKNNSKKLVKIAEKHASNSIILWCTELPIIFEEERSLKTYDTTFILAEKTFNELIK